jgi:hypothetical protein
MCHCHRHLTARFSTATTRLGATTAMLVVVLATFSSTKIASIRTNPTQLSVQLGITTHKTGAKGTQIGAIDTGFDAICHHLYHVAIETGSGAIFTVLETLKTGFEASL